MSPQQSPDVCVMSCFSDRYERLEGLGDGVWEVLAREREAECACLHGVCGGGGRRGCVLVMEDNGRTLGCIGTLMLPRCSVCLVYESCLCLLLSLP